jgi:DNA invertase Pin-like site-specific DNA recombinase
MYLNDFDSYTVYSELVDNEFGDITERTELNRLIHSANAGEIDAVFVSDIKVFSPISIKALQAIISLQEVGMSIHYPKGQIESDDENIKIFKKQMEDNSEKNS